MIHTKIKIDIITKGLVSKDRSLCRSNHLLLLLIMSPIKVFKMLIQNNSIIIRIQIKIEASNSSPCLTIIVVWWIILKTFPIIFQTSVLIVQTLPKWDIMAIITTVMANIPTTTPQATTTVILIAIKTTSSIISKIIMAAVISKETSRITWTYYPPEDSRCNSYSKCRLLSSNHTNSHKVGKTWWQQSQTVQTLN